MKNPNNLNFTPHQERRSKPTFGRKVGTIAVLGLALYGGEQLAVSATHSADHFLKGINGNVYSTNDLDARPKEVASTSPGVGAAERDVLSVDPDLGQQKNWPALADLENYVEQQGAYEGKPVEVPKIQPTPTHKQ